MPLRIATYNIHGGIGTDGERDYRRIGELINSLQIDVALLQEVDARHGPETSNAHPKALCSDNSLKLISAPAIVTDKGWYGNALLSRWPVLESQAIDVSQMGVEPRNIQSAIVDVNGRRCRVINTHKGLKTAERRLQFRKLYEHLILLSQQPEPIILGGDFNEWQFFTRAFKAINSVLTPVKPRATFPTRWPLFKLDRLWLSAEAQVRHSRIEKTPATRLYSDHYPVIAEVEIPA